MKLQTVSIKQRLLFFIASVLLFILGYSLARAKVAQDASVNLSSLVRTERTQIGFYDILANKKEIYDLEIKSALANSYIMSLKIEEDPRFILRGKIIISHTDDMRFSQLDFTPVYYHNPQPNRMINSFVDYTTHNDFLIRDLFTNQSQLIVARSGMLILMPEIFAVPAA